MSGGIGSLSRSRQELEAARLLAGGGYGRQAISRAYFAAFHAAEAALLLLGETRSKHAGVISAFGQLVAKSGGLQEEIARLLRSLFERRNEADCWGAEVPAEEADRAIYDAERFVDAVGVWISERSK